MDDEPRDDDAQARAERIVAQMMARDAFSRWLGIEVLAVAPGRARLRMTVREEMLNGFAVAHGGVTYALADSALAFASNTRGRVALALENSIFYPAPVHAGDVLTAVAEEISAANRVAAYDVTVTRADGTKVAVFRGTVYRTKQSHD
ncbi:hydroxyphenylacetyl-CoA thioesterase PaaI [Rhodocaloribacter litoris]|uniref:hydroxyphenylacetyl-CoA thioesterase PaaI n=1 Tax=Rhodocaloribacter litoris TaxID=2558931 RepID=UPI00141D9308|nr:hydroxyphenylacetyl-CoA thioesterase PaaI [Rhodocaloribacter litoris]QXD16254.1 hydroxyphenylacetyl-CoA thioesterase PaaI [Rhodocaloribacter litoris]